MHVPRDVLLLAALILFASPSHANVLPESALLVHIGDSEPQPVVTCTQIVASTTATGHVAFEVYFMRCSYFPPDEVLCLAALDGHLQWPENWNLVQVETFGDAECTIDPAGESNPWIPEGYRNHAWSMAFPASSYSLVSMDPEGVVPILRVVLDVVGTGSLRPMATVTLRHDCVGAAFTTVPNWEAAKAGLVCGYWSPRCLYQFYCYPNFHINRLELTVPTGSVVRDTVTIGNDHNEYIQCGYSIDTHASWCEASYFDHMQYPPYHIGYLAVEANAAGLAPGVYETDIYLTNVGHPDYFSACLPVVLDVTGDVATEAMSWSTIKALYR